MAILVKMTELSMTEIESVVATTTSQAFFEVPVSSVHQYYAVLVVCCADVTTETFTDCTWEFDGTDWVLVGSPEGCDCSAVPAIPSPHPATGTRTHIPCGGLPD
ncbi:MAG: hypothetical protein U0930_04730 [Pirellulales bacterium]